MKKLLLLHFFWLAILHNSELHSQTFSYSYDYAGNRTEKVILLLKSASANNDALPLKDESFDDMEVVIYPNPTDGILNVGIKENSLQEKSGNDITFSIYDISGRLIKQVKGSQGNTTIDISGEMDGVYMLLLRRNNTTSRWKIIKR